jgi:hypothetical protein
MHYVRNGVTIIYRVEERVKREAITFLLFLCGVGGKQRTKKQDQLAEAQPGN